MIELKKFRGKYVLITGGNVVNDILSIVPELFPYVDVEQANISFPENIEISFTSSDNVDTDYNTLEGGDVLEVNGIVIRNIKIKSVSDQTGYIYTAGL